MRSLESVVTCSCDTHAVGDLLTGYDGNTIFYDAIGNPINDGTWYYNWKQGRQLDSMERVSDGALWFFTYNADGMRTKRTNGSVTYQYTYHGNLYSMSPILINR